MLGTAAQARRVLQGILGAALAAADPAALLLRAVARQGDALHVGGREIALPAGRLLLLAAGKAAGPMASALEQLLADRAPEGLVVVPAGTPTPRLRAEVLEAAHPLPDEASFAAGSRFLEAADGAGPADLVVVLVSGGASALIEAPAPGLEPQDLRATARALLAAGASVHELNRVRRSLSAIKGGRLAARARPARVLGLALSDVVGDRPESIGSGPTVAAAAEPGAARAVLERYGLSERVPERVRRYLRDEPDAVAPGRRPDDDPAGVTYVIADNRVIVEAAHAAARVAGYLPVRIGRCWTGEAREAGGRLARIALRMRRAQPRRALCLIAAGETTVTVRGPGRGGRNQELALGAARVLDGVPDIWLCSAGTDGTDGPTRAAGAFADGATMRRAAALGHDLQAILDANDSHTLLGALGDLVVTGPTGTNLMDIQLVLIGSPGQ